jgi:hypothetical protein
MAEKKVPPATKWDKTRNPTRLQLDERRGGVTIETEEPRADRKLLVAIAAADDAPVLTHFG